MALSRRLLLAGQDRPLHQERLDERVEVSVKHSIYGTDLNLCSHILDHLVGMEDLSADLTAPGDVAFLRVLCVLLLVALLHLQIEQPRLEHLQCG